MPLSSSGTSASEALYDLSAGAARSAVVVGTAKNVGKTTAFNALREIARRRGVTIGVTSIGRDGEPVDAVTSAPKPRVRLATGTVVALPEGLVPASPALEILGRGAWTALGAIVYARAVIPTTCEIGGPPTRRAMRATIERLCGLVAGPVIVDGAIDRVAALAAGDDAIVVATGAASGDSVEAVAAVARRAVARLMLPGRDARTERARVVIVGGALDAREARSLIERASGATVVVADPTRIAVGGALFDELLSAVDLRCEHPLRVVAVTTSSVADDVVLDPEELAGAVARATRLPVFDLVADVAA